MDYISDIEARITLLENKFATHLGPKPAATSLNMPHQGVPYLTKDGTINPKYLPPVTPVPVTGYYF